MGLSLQNQPSHEVQQLQPQPAERAKPANPPLQTLASQELRHAVMTNNSEVVLDPADCQILCALAAIQIRYGKAHEAAVYLMAVRQHHQRHPDATRLLATAFMKMEKWSEAERMVEEYKAITGSQNRMLLLYRAIIEFKKSKIGNARAWLAKFVNSKGTVNV